MSTAEGEKRQPRAAADGALPAACLGSAREPTVRHERPTSRFDEPTLDQKLDFLRRSSAYSHPVTG